MVQAEIVAELVRDRVRPGVQRSGRKERVSSDRDPVIADPTEAIERARHQQRRAELVDKEQVDRPRVRAQRGRRRHRAGGRQWYRHLRDGARRVWRYGCGGGGNLIREGPEVRAVQGEGVRGERKWTFG